MPVSDTPRSAGPFLGDGSATSFPFGFRVFATTDILVQATTGSVIEAFTLGTDYTVTLNADQTTSPGGVVTTTLALPLGTSLAIVGDLPLTQTAALPQGGNYSAIVVQNALDRTVMLLQQIAEGFDRALHFPVGDAAVSELPPVAARSGLALGFDSLGNPVVLAAAPSGWISPQASTTIRAFGNGVDVSGGIVDATAAILAALNSGATEIDGEHLTYRVTAAVFKAFAAGTRVKVKNFHLLSSGISDNTSILTLTAPGIIATYGISPVAQGSPTVTLTTGAVAVGARLRVGATNLWSDTAVTGVPSVTMGEWADVTGVAGSVLTLAQPLRYDYTAGAYVEVCSMADRIEVENVTAQSDNPAFLHVGVTIQNAYVARAKGSGGVNCSNAGVSFDRCVYTLDEDCSNFEPNATLGFAYVVVVGNTCRQATHVRPRGRGCRHISANGGYIGVLACVTIIDPVGDNQMEGVIDGHAAVDQQNVIFGNTGFSTSANSKLVSTQARSLRVFGAQCKGVQTGVLWSPACTAYSSSCEIHGDIDATHNAVDIEQRSTQPIDSIELFGKFTGGSGGTGDAVIVTANSSMVGTPGQVKRIIVLAHVIGLAQRGVYLVGGGMGQTFGDVVCDGRFEAPAAAGCYPISVDLATVNDVLSLELRGACIGGDYAVKLSNVSTALARLHARGFLTDAFSNSQSGASDALNRFDLQAITPSTVGVDQHRGQVTVNGTTPVVVNNSAVRTAPASRIHFALLTAAGTPGPVRSTALVNKTSFSAVSAAGDTSTYLYWLENPVIGP